MHFKTNRKHWAPFLVILLQFGCIAGSEIDELLKSLEVREPETPAQKEPHEYLDFLLPYVNDELGHQCMQHSRFFCVMGYYSDTKESDRVPQDNDTQEFTELILPAFKELNWFSFKPQDQENGGCCTHQVNMYLEYGQKNGLSPEQYYNKIYGRQSIDTKKLVFVKAKWDKKICLNVITRLGYGSGELKVVARRGLNSRFAMPPIGDIQHVPVFLGENLQSKMTFMWFLAGVVCRDKPEDWTCSHNPENDNLEIQAFNHFDSST